MAGRFGLEKENGMGRLILAESGGEFACMAPKLGVGHTGEEHAALPLRGRKTADGISE